MMARCEAIERHDPDYDEIWEAIHIWEFRNYGLGPIGKEIAEKLAAMCKAHEYNGRQLSPVNSWRVAGMVTTVLDTLYEAGLLTGS
jgi:hypothetical protein